MSDKESSFATTDNKGCMEIRYLSQIQKKKVQGKWPFVENNYPGSRTNSKALR